MEIPGFVAAYMRPLLAQGIGPYRWIALSGDPEDLRKSEDALMEVVDRPTLRNWIKLAREPPGPPGAAGPHLLAGARAARRGGTAAERAGPRRARSARWRSAAITWIPPRSPRPRARPRGCTDGSDAIADWPILGALLNAAQGASWVAVGNGGGVGIGRSIHSGMVVVADGSELAQRKIARVFWSDPALGVARYADAGYEAALAQAERSELNLPMPERAEIVDDTARDDSPRLGRRSRRPGPRPAGRERRPRRAFTMSIDTGGTFTDGFVSDGAHTAQVKVDTTPQDLTIGFQACLEAAAAAVGHELPGFLGALSRLHFSSTIATNTIVERRGAPIGLIVTRGARGKSLRNRRAGSGAGQPARP